MVRASNARRSFGATLARIAGWIVAGILLTAALWLAWVAAHIAWYRSFAPGETAFMAQRIAEAHAKNPKAELRYRFVPYARISMQLKRAMIAAEDAKFVDHEGFDWEGIERAREKNERRGKIVAGGSTITQQLAKNLFLSPAQSYFGVSAAQLNAEQAARLAAMAPNPRFYERNQGAPGLNRKIGIILARMPGAEVP